MQSNVHPPRLGGKRIVITAGASGMGRAGAELFTRHGATVCVVDYHAENAVKTVAAIEAAGGKASAIVADLTSASESRRIVHEAAQQMGGIDGFWAHAGMPGPHGIEGLDEEAYRRCMDLNVTSALASIGEAVPFLRKGSNGVVLVTSSTSGLVGSRFSPIYSIAKFGVIGMVKSLAQGLGPEGIRVNALCPGITETPMMGDFMNDSARSKFLESIPLRRIAQSSEMATAALWLMSDEASFVSGIALPVDGGFTAG
ncbi:SDR family NAD(P)-dependent oxidoreductase [Variovorax paradoxus]|uniref:SDR family NAD(P)-dependent oxidoreductase n=1 Tax=Variovorax paradoxus TaxID=34073 RepID=UPI0024796E2A